MKYPKAIMRIVMGIDQGSTQTRAALCSEEGEILGVGYAGGASHSYDGIHTAMQNVQKAILAAKENAIIEADEIKMVFAGMSGADWPDEPPMLASNIKQLGNYPSVRVVNDAIIALRAGTEKPYGAILIGGTGANCAIRSPQGEEFIFGFYHDPALMGAHAITRQAMFKIFQNYAYQGKTTLMTQAFLESLHFNNVDQMCREFYQQKIPNLHMLVPLVFEADRQGDWVAREILTQYGKGSANLLLAGLRRFHMTKMQLEIVVSGSIFKVKDSSLLRSLTSELARRVPGARVVNAKYEPVVGALLLALESLGVTMEEKALHNIETSARRLNLLRAVQTE